MKKVCLIFTIIYLFCGTSNLQAQKFNRNNYLDYLPSQPKIICQTKASNELNLYGDPDDPNYIDENPVDGIDDHRKGRLDTLAAIFSPILRRNNFSTPQDFEKMLRLRLDRESKQVKYDKRGILFVDTWDLTQPESKRIQSKSDSIDLGLLAKPLDDDNDTKLKDLLMEFHPDSSKIQKIDPNCHQQKMLFFDFPGTGEKSWRKIYKHISSDDSKIYAHFFIHKDTTAKSPAQYELVIQYWFFSPFNDAGNNHEGDWEHINVSITTIDKATINDRQAELLTTRDIHRILTHPFNTIKDSLIIKRVDYYFHHFVTTLDYQALDFLQDRKSFKDTLKRLDEDKLFRSWIYHQIYNRIHLLRDTLNTHPIAYIGADNMGLDQILALPGGKNQNGHGTYPFPGVWKHIGPLGATEKINGAKEYKFLLPPIEGDRFIAYMDTVDLEPHYEAAKNPNFVTYRRNDIIIVPDWECVIDSALNNPEVRRKWSWLMLPIRFGFPVVESPGAGAFKHTDLGNTAPVGPSYNSGWNRVAACRGYEEYDPHVLPSRFLFGLQDNFQNSWGFLNLTWPTLISLPVTNIIWASTGSRLKFNPKFFPRQELPFRFASIAYCPTYTIGDDNFARLLPQEDNTMIRAFLERHSNSVIDSKNLNHKNYHSLIDFMFCIHLGRYASENSISISSSKLQYDITNPTGQAIGTVKGDLKFYEFTGSLKHCFLKSNFQPFVRIGYGWNFYRVENITSNLENESFNIRKSKWYHKPPLWILPNTGHLGCGLELFVKRNYGINQIPILQYLFFVGKPEIGIRLEYTFHFHKLGIDIPGDDWVFRNEFGAGIVVGF